MDDEGNTRDGDTRHSDFEKNALDAMRPERPDVTREIEGDEDDGSENGGSGFLNSDKNGTGDKKKEAKRYAASDLGDAERNATESSGIGGDNNNAGRASGVDEAKDKEFGGYYKDSQKEPRGFRGMARGIKGKLFPQKGKKSGFVKHGALTTMFMFLMFGAFVSTSTMSTQLNAWKENIYSMFGQNSAVMTKRSNFLLNSFLNTNKSVTRQTILGKTRYSIGKKMASNLEKEHIYYVDEDVEGKKVRMLVYVDEDGKATPIVADGREIDSAKSLAGKEYEFGGKKVALSDSPMVLSQAKTEYDSFSSALNKSTLTVTGKMAGWFSQFGDVPKQLLNRLIGPNARNQMGDLNDDSTKEQVEEKVTKPSKMQDGDFDARERKSEDEEDTDSDEEAAEKDRIRNEDSKLAGGDVSAITEKLKAKAEKAAAYGGGASLLCGFLKAMGSISSTVGAIQTSNAIDFTSKYLEIADKIEAQDANNSVNLANELLNEPRENEIYDTSQHDEEGHSKRVDEGKKTPTTASVGFNAAFSQDDIIDENSPVTKMVNRENTLTVALENVKGTPGEIFAPLLNEFAKAGSGVAAASICNAIKFGTSAAGLIADIATVFAPGSGIIKALLDNVMNVSKVQIIMAAAGFIIGLIAPIVTQWVGSTLSKVVFGEVGGTVLWAGAQALMNSNLQMSTGLLPDKQGAMDVFGLTKEVEKEEWARQDRIALSPFDTSSKYTFLGSIVNSFVPIINRSSNGVVNTMSSIAKLAGDSALALTSSTASAAEKVYKYELSLASEDNCYRLHSVGAEGTETCHKYNGASVQDLDTLDADDILVKIYELDKNSFDGTYDDGNPKVNPDSDLARYLVACVANDSQPGDVDASVQGFIMKSQEAMSTGDSLTDSLIDFGAGLVPFSDLPDLGAAIEEQKYMVWNSKEACTGRTDDPQLNEKVRYFATFPLDQRVMEEMGVIETNSAMAFLEDYYEENPLDQSYEGRIARFAGQTKEEVETNLAYLDYMVALYEYEPSERYAFGESEVKIDKPLRLDHQSEIQVADAREKVSNEFMQVEYADVRNRVALV